MLNNGPLNLPADNMHSLAALRMNRCVQGHCKEVSEIMKMRFGLITFYQCFECCLKRFALLHSIQGIGENTLR